MPLPEGCWPSHDTGKMAILVISAKYVIAAAIDVQSGLPEQKSESWELFSLCVLKILRFGFLVWCPIFERSGLPERNFLLFFEFGRILDFGNLTNISGKEGCRKRGKT